MKLGMWWHPWKGVELEDVKGLGLYTFAKGPKGDTYMPLFAISFVPILVLHVGGIVPRLSELAVFHEGMAIGVSELEFPAPSPDFMQWSYEHYIAAPLKVGNHIEVKMESGWVRGRIVDGQFDELVICVEYSEDLDVIEVPAHNVRWYYQIGNIIKVIHAANICHKGFVGHEGFVFNVNTEVIEVLDSQDKEPV